ncbi:MAG: DUF2341 domain-containing protein [Myxococcota bacterium]|nr:DUF2341 domain-containing protein [Myxococcota bacterium]
MARAVGLFAALLLLGCGGEYSLGAWPDGAVLDAGLDAQIPGDCWPDFSHRVRITVDGRSYDDPLADFPILVSLPPGALGTGIARDDGADLRFVLADCTPLPHEVETWDPAATSHVWVRLPQAGARATHDLDLYFGDPTASDVSSPNGVFTADYVGVYHLDEDDPFRDSSASRSPPGSNRSTTATEAQVGDGRLVGGGSVVVSDNPFPVGESPRSVCVWNRTDDDGASYYWMFSYGIGDRPVGAFALGRHGEQLQCQGADGTTLVGYDVYIPGDRSWRYSCCTYGEGQARLYSDGAHVIERARAWPVTPSTANLGSAQSGSNSWIGAIDEVRVSSVVRSDDWIAAEHASMTGALVTIGALEPR